MDKIEFVEGFKLRTKNFAIAIIMFLRRLRSTEEMRIVSRQLIRSASSVASNYRAACRARSKAEFFSKMSIVVEEADETILWLEIVEETGLDSSSELKLLKKEATEILSIVATARKTVGGKRQYIIT